jgi:hypothetical protein
MPSGRLKWDWEEVGSCCRKEAWMWEWLELEVVGTRY